MYSEHSAVGSGDLRDEVRLQERPEVRLEGVALLAETVGDVRPGDATLVIVAGDLVHVVEDRIPDGMGEGLLPLGERLEVVDLLAEERPVDVRDQFALRDVGVALAFTFGRCHCYLLLRRPDINP
jgi:hypothetical protein